MGENFIFTLNSDQFERTINSKYCRNVVCGSGRMAKDLRKKLEILGLEVDPYLYGSFDDETENIKRYENLRNISNPEECRFHLYADPEEWYLNSRFSSIIKGMLGKMWPHIDHTQIVQWALTPTRDEHVGKWEFDIFNSRVRQSGGSYFTENRVLRDDDLRVQLFGASSITDIFKYNQVSITELLDKLLLSLDMRCHVENKSQMARSFADNITRFLLFGNYAVPDLVIFFIYEWAHHMRFAKNNMLSLRPLAYGNVESAISAPHLKRVIGEGNAGTDSMLNSRINEDDMTLDQVRVLNTFSKLFGFKLWICIPPSIYSLPVKTAGRISIRSASYISRLHNRNAMFIEKCSKLCKVLDLSGVFNSYDDIFPFFVDESHMTLEGSAVFTEALAYEIAKEFPQYTGKS